LDDFYLVAVGENLLHEVVSGIDGELENGVILVPFQFFLRVVQRQGTQVLALVMGVVHLQSDVFHVVVVRIVLNAEAVDEEGAHVDAGGYGVRSVRDGHVFHAVEGIDAQSFHVGNLRHHVPAAVEQFDEIRLQHTGAGLLVAESLVDDAQAFLPLHGVQYVKEVFFARGNVLGHDAVAHAFAATEDVVDGKTADEAVAKLVIVDFLGVYEEVSSAMRVVADGYFKVGFDVVKVFAERPFGNALFVEIVVSAAAPLFHHVVVAHSLAVPEECCRYPEAPPHLYVFAQSAHNLSCCWCKDNISLGKIVADEGFFSVT